LAPVELLSFVFASEFIVKTVGKSLLKMLNLNKIRVFSDTAFAGSFWKNAIKLKPLQSIVFSFSNRFLSKTRFSCFSLLKSCLTGFQL